MDINVKFMHPTDGRLLSVELDSSITAKEAIEELISADFVPASEEGYSLAIKGGAMLRWDEPFCDAGVEDGTTMGVTSRALQLENQWVTKAVKPPNFCSQDAHLKYFQQVAGALDWLHPFESVNKMALPSSRP